MESILCSTSDHQVIKMTNHAKIRASQRGIADYIITRMVLDGEVIKKQGLRYFYMTKKTLKYFDLKLQDKLRNLVVILTTDDAVLTCYKNANAIKNIKLKPKRLSRYSKNGKRNIN